MLQFEPHRRATAADMLKHPFLNQHNKQQAESDKDEH